MKPLLLRWVVTAFAVFLTALIMPGIHFDTLGAFLWATLLLGMVNALIRPVLMLLSLPLILLTMGLFVLVVNAMMLKLVSALVSGFYVDNFRTAFFASIIIGIVSWILNGLSGGSARPVHPASNEMKQVSGRVIDI